MLILEAIVIKNKMVNNGNSDDSKNEENKNNSQKITLVQNWQQIQKNNILGLDYINLYDLYKYYII